MHADHLTGSKFLREALRSKGHRAYTGIGERVVEVQRVFKQMFNLGEEFKTDGSQFGQLFTDGYSAMIGDVSFKVMSTPGHTPACVTYLIGDAAFVGDTYFFPDFGTARCDFPGELHHALHHGQRYHTHPSAMPQAEVLRRCISPCQSL